MTLTIASDTGKRYAAWAIAYDKVIISADLVKVVAAPNLHGPEYRQGSFKQPDCDLAWKIANHIRSDVCIKAKSSTDVEFIAEVPTSKDRRAKKLRSGDLIFLAITAGAISAAIPVLGYAKRVRYIEPSEWKGQAPDAACWKRIEDALSKDEKQRIGREALEARFGKEFHHALESVGILLWSMHRI